jgi:hypothetical protein
VIDDAAFDHGHRFAGKQSLSADLVDVLVVDNRDVTEPEPLGELLGALVNAHGPPDTGQDRVREGLVGAETGTSWPCCHDLSLLPPPAGQADQLVTRHRADGSSDITSDGCGHLSRSSLACSIATSESSTPAIIRASSLSRSFPSRATTHWR